MRTQKRTKRTGRPGKRAGERGKGKPDKPLHTQDFIPIKDIRNGIIETADGRYVKIVEIEPINFLLRSPEEQWGIISSFASWLKISPVRLQFKSISRKADSDKHIASVERNLLREENGQCERLAREYIGLIRDVSSKEALTRRFFLCFEYEALPGRRGSDSYADIHSALQNAAQNAKTYFLQCGNAIRQTEDENAFAAEILYVFFNRRACAGEPFAARVERVVVDAMRARRLTIGKDPVPEIPAVDFIAPRGLDLTHYNYTVIDGTYYTFLYIRRNGYPNAVRAGWMSALINAGEGVDVDIHLRRENRGRTLDKVSQRIRLNRSKMRSVQDTSTDYEELSNSIRSGYYIKSAIANNNEDLFYLSVFITVSASSLDELSWRKNQVADMLKSMDIQCSETLFQQEAALRSVFPLLRVDPNLEKKSSRNILTSGAASTYMFTSFEMSDDNGVLLGINRHNNSLCVLDLFNTKVNKNANVCLLGSL